jgi:hypothetical protein
MYLEMYSGSGDEHKLEHAAALPHRRNNLWVAHRGSTIYRLPNRLVQPRPGVGANLVGAIFAQFVKGGLEMARTDRCVASPHFLAETDFRRMHVQRAHVQRAHVQHIRGAALFAGAMLLSILGAIPAMSAEYRGTQDQQQACTPDVMRLCADSVPDVNRIVSCLRRNRSNLSAPCGAVFGASGAHRPKKG